MRWSLRKEAGDTIIEVLIATAIVGAVIGSSIAVINHILINAQQAKEHEEALELLEGQVETLKVAALHPNASPTLNVFSHSGPFCLNDDGTLVAIADSVLPTSYDKYSGCQKGTDNRYNLGLIQKPSTSNTFYAYANWDGPSGGQEQVNIIYKVYPPSP